MSQLQYWVWLSMRFGVRPKMKLALVEHFGTPRDVYFATEADYRVRVPLRPEELRLLLDKDLKDANRALAICDREHIRILTIQDAAYPQRLLQIYDPPLVLYVRGTLRENIAPAPETQAPEPPPETGSGFAQVRRPVAEKRIDKPQPEAYIDLEAQLKSLTTEQLQIVAAIDAPGTQVDLIIEKTQLPASKVLAELTVLQIRGVVRQEPGKRFSLNIRAGTAQNHKELE